jgi:hypothetical protein
MLVSATGAGGRGPSVDVLEVIDADEAIVRAWYVADAATALDSSATAEPTFVDLWVQGIDTRGLAAGSKATAHGVFRVTGSKSFDTTCGGRSVPALELVEPE